MKFIRPFLISWAGIFMMVFLWGQIALIEPGQHATTAEKQSIEEATASLDYFHPSQAVNPQVNGSKTHLSNVFFTNPWDFTELVSCVCATTLTRRTFHDFYTQISILLFPFHEFL